MTTKESAEVIRAYEKGEKIVARYKGGGEWIEVDKPAWNWLEYDYRTKSQIEKGQTMAMTTQEKIKIMQAYERGEQIQVKMIYDKDVWTTVKRPIWDWGCCVYRTIPKSVKFELPQKLKEKMNKTEAIGAIYLLKQEIAQTRKKIEDGAGFFMHDVRPEQKWDARRLQERVGALLAALEEIAQKDSEMDKLISEFNITEIIKDNQ